MVNDLDFKEMSCGHPISEVLKNLQITANSDDLANTESDRKDILHLL